MTPTEARLARERDGAMMFGEKSADIAIKQAFRIRDLRRAMYKARHQLKIGKTSEAAQTIDRALHHDDR